MSNMEPLSVTCRSTIVVCFWKLIFAFSGSLQAEHYVITANMIFHIFYFIFSHFHGYYTFCAVPYSRYAGFDPTSMQSPSAPRSGTVYFRTLFDRCTSLSGFTRFLEFCILVHLCRIVCIIRCLSEQMCHFPGHAHSLMYRL